MINPMGFSLLLLLALESESWCVFNENIQKSLKQMILLILFFEVKKKLSNSINGVKSGVSSHQKAFQSKRLATFPNIYLSKSINLWTTLTWHKSFAFNSTDATTFTIRPFKFNSRYTIIYYWQQQWVLAAI